MHFSLNTILAVVPFLTTAASAAVMGIRTNDTVAFRGCFDGGEKWTDLGTTEQIYAALDENACDVDTGGWRLGAKIDMCIVVEKTNDFNQDNSFRFSWTITKLPEGKELGNLSHDVCVGFAEQIINSCPHGGVMDLMSGPGADGGDIIGAAITADPQQGPSCGTAF